ncbi:exonuclease domain-containing protein [Burkholderia sp. Ac-20379]|uniref:exonuclease domain-containing protein n=1 Tax=Burkholderia sp. Ac-20379 TaxID=2703900 RepID=UPI00197F8779|nr:exonuclease domain-containing protein [Burkholderia sp. Ac-20379]MBN3723754.1 DNA polymerase III subunit epsilon [Burkholderia sp. Ac-20379]
MSDLSSSLPVIDAPLVFVDLETTGGSAADHRITEVGVVEVGPDGVSTWTSLIDPRQPIPAFIQQLTGITDEMVRGAPTFASIAAELYARLDGKLFIAHNASFDRGFLRAEFERAGLAFNPDMLCTVRLSRALFPREARHGLDALIERHALVPNARHRALADADLVWQFWQRLPALVPAGRLAEQIDQATRRYRLGGNLTEDDLERAPAGCGAYALFGEDDAPLFIGRSVRVRNRLRALLTGERRSAKERKLAEQVRRIAWRETRGELGAMLAEAAWIAELKPPLNRKASDARRSATGSSTPWPFDGPVAIVETEGGVASYLVADNWRYLGAAASIAQASELAVALAPGAGAFHAGICRILQTHLARGLETVPLAPAAATAATAEASAAE